MTGEHTTMNTTNKHSLFANRKYAIIYKVVNLIVKESNGKITPTFKGVK